MQSQVFYSSVARRKADSIESPACNQSPRVSNDAKHARSTIECVVGLPRFVLKLSSEPPVGRCCCRCRGSEACEQCRITPREERSLGKKRIRSLRPSGSAEKQKKESFPDHTNPVVAVSPQDASIGIQSWLYIFSMLNIDLTGRRALVAGVADDGGFGFAIAKALAEAGASVSVGTWPPALNIFNNLLERGKMDESRRLSNGELLQFERIYPLDAAFDTLADAPDDLKSSKRYKDTGDFSIDGLVARITSEFGEKSLDIVVHSLANGPEVKKPLLETSRNGYLTAIGVSAYSLVSMVSRLAPIMRPGGSFLSLTYMASEKVIPGYGGGMSSAKAALESDTRTLAYEAGQKFGVRVNTISAGPYASRAASAIGIIERMVNYCAQNSPLPDPLTADEVGAAAAFLSSPLASGITGTTLYVDKGYHSMGMAVSMLGESGNASPSDVR